MLSLRLESLRVWQLLPELLGRHGAFHLIKELHRRYGFSRLASSVHLHPVLCDLVRNCITVPHVSLGDGLLKFCAWKAFYHVVQPSVGASFKQFLLVQLWDPLSVLMASLKLLPELRVVGLSMRLLQVELQFKIQRLVVDQRAVLLLLNRLLGLPQLVLLHVLPRVHVL